MVNRVIKWLYKACINLDNPTPSMIGHVGIKTRDCLDYIFGKGGGGKLVFPPKTNVEATEDLLDVLHQSPYELGYGESRWTLIRIRSACSWLKVETDSGVWRLLQRLGIVKKQGRIALHSPDVNYQAKLEYLDQCWQEAVAYPREVIFLYLDEFSYYRQPTVTLAYEQRGNYQWRANLSHRSNTRCRGIGALNAMTGQVHYRQADKIRTKVQVAFYRDIVQSYPQARTIYVAQDNWPNHAAPAVMAHLEAQRTPFFPNTFSNWSTAERYMTPPDALPIQLVFLPTYAPWTNPIEKLWRWVRQDILHLHRLSDQWGDLKQRVMDFMMQFEHGSTQLLHYIGLLPD